MIASNKKRLVQAALCPPTAAHSQATYQLPTLTAQARELLAKRDAPKVIQMDKARDITAYFEVLGQLSAQHRTRFLKDALPSMADACLNAHTILGQSLPLLTCYNTRVLRLSQKQVFTLLSLSFFNLLPIQKGHSLPYPVNLTELMSSKEHRQEKLKALIHYFILAEKSEAHFIAVQRLQKPNVQQHFQTESNQLDLPTWKSSRKELCEVRFEDTGSIEDQENATIVDFANHYVGGGVLAHGAAQEEIQFLINPEAIVSLFFCTVMKPDEAIQITGIKQYSRYEGYRKTFKSIPLDKPIDKKQTILAIDAYNYMRKKKSLQWQPEMILRDLNKAFIGFSGKEGNISTGRWGCGIFMGNSQLKFVQQWLACSQLGDRTLIFYRFEDKSLERAREVYERWRREVRVGELVGMVLREEGEKELFGGA